MAYSHWGHQIWVGTVQFVLIGNMNFWSIRESVQLLGGYKRIFREIATGNSFALKDRKLFSPATPVVSYVWKGWIVPTEVWFQSLCSSIFMATMVGENHPRASKIHSMSDTSTLLVSSFRVGGSVTVRRNSSALVTHSIPRVFVDFSLSPISWEFRPSCKDDLMCCITLWSFEFQLCNSKSPFWKRHCSSLWMAMAVWTLSAAVSPSST